MARSDFAWFLGMGLLCGCVPVRDNPRDPAHAPVADLKIRSLGVLPWSECESKFAAGTHGELVLVASRGACLTLDASESTDPQNDTLSFTFSLPLPGLESVDNGTASRFLLTSARALEIGAPENELTVRVEDDGGAWSEAHTKLGLTNSAPRAVAPPLKLLPSGGFPWDIGTAMPVTFDGSRSEDPDLDQLTFSWILPDGTTSADSKPVWLAPPAAGTHRATLTVTDGLLGSRDVSSNVRVGEPPLWGLVDFEKLERFDPFLPVVFDTRASITVATFVPPASGDSGGWLAYGRQQSGEFSINEVRIASLDDGAEISQLSSAALTLGAGPGLLWTFDSDGLIEAFTFAPDGTPTSAVGPFTVPGNVVFDFSVPTAKIGVAPDGSAWLGIEGATLGVVRVDGNGVQLLEEIDPDLVTYAVTHRPATTEMWELRSIEGNVLPRSVIVRWNQDGTRIGEPRELPGQSITQLAWLGSDELWIAEGGSGLRLLDAITFGNGASLEESTIAFVESPGTRIGALSRESGTLWGISTSDALLVSPDGRAATFDTVESLLVHLLDSEDRVWFEDFGALASNGIRRAGTLDPAGRLTSVQFRGSPVVDQTRGWVWLYDSLPSTFRLATLNGVPDRTVKSVLWNGQLEPLPLLDRPTVSPDGRFAWSRIVGAGGADSIGRIDLSLDPPVLVSVPTSPAFALNAFRLLAPPPPREDVWAYVEDPMTGEAELGTLSVDGTFASRVTFPVTSGLLALAPASPRVCAVSNSGGTLTIEWISADDPPELLFSSSDLVYLTGVATTIENGNEEVCWAMVGDSVDYRVIAVTSDAVLLDETFPGLTGVVLHAQIPRSLGEIWLTTGDGVTSTRTLLRDTGSGWTRTDLPAPANTTFIHAWGP